MNKSNTIPSSSSTLPPDRHMILGYMDYTITPQGEVFSTEANPEMIPVKDKPFPHVYLEGDDGMNHQARVRDLLALAFFLQQPAKHIVVCEDRRKPLDPDHLAWFPITKMTRSQLVRNLCANMGWGRLPKYRVDFPRRAKFDQPPVNPQVVGAVMSLRKPGPSQYTWAAFAKVFKRASGKALWTEVNYSLPGQPGFEAALNKQTTRLTVWGYHLAFRDSTDSYKRRDARPHRLRTYLGMHTDAVQRILDECYKDRSLIKKLPAPNVVGMDLYVAHNYLRWAIEFRRLCGFVPSKEVEQALEILRLGSLINYTREEYRAVRERLKAEQEFLEQTLNAWDQTVEPLPLK